MCYSSSAHIGDIRENEANSVRKQRFWKEILLCVDGNASGGASQTIEEVGKNLKDMEKEKRLRFYTDKTKQ